MSKPRWHRKRKRGSPTVVLCTTVAPETYDRLCQYARENADNNLGMAIDALVPRGTTSIHNDKGLDSPAE